MYSCEARSNKAIVSFAISLPIPTETKSACYYFPFRFGCATKTQQETQVKVICAQANVYANI
ncbi:hypothetical protein Hdeb2414_s0101g00793731 [Helianthus debilis subsp. tardiflorus]